MIYTMNITLILYILFSVSLSAIAQLVLKAGMSGFSSAGIFNKPLTLGTVWLVFTNWFVLGGLLLYFTSALVWLYVLSKVDVSVAYPFVGVGFIITMLSGYYFFYEPLTLVKVLGTLMIGVGIICITRG